MPRVPGTRTGVALGSPRATSLPLLVVPGSALPGAVGFAKQDTLYWAYDGGGGINDLANDRSQYDTDQTVGATWTSEASPATRFNLTDQWCFEFAFTASSTTTGRLFQYDCVTAASDLSLRVSSNGIFDIIINAAVSATKLTLPDILAIDQRFVFSWSAEPNVDTTGAADALRHHLCAWNLDTGGFDRVTFTSVLRPGQVGVQTIWAATAAGSNPFTGRPIAVRMGRRLHSATETAHDFVDILGAPSTVTDTDDQGLPVSNTIGFASRSAFHGPAAAWACDATRRMQHRMLSVLWNDCFRINTEWTNTELDVVDDPLVRGAPNDNDWRLHLTFLRSYPVPPGATHLWVRVHLRSYKSTGATPFPVGARLYSFNKNPSAADGPALISFFVDEVVNRIDTEGSYIIRAKLPIAVGDDGFTWLSLGLAFDPVGGAGNPGAARLTVQAVHVVPIVVDQPGGLGFGQGGMGS